MINVALALLNCVKDKTPINGVGSEGDVDNLISLHVDKVELLLVNCKEIDDPVYQFWRLHQAGVLGDECHIVFLTIKSHPSWDDLSLMYRAIQFGGMFLCVYKKHTAIRVLPSQKGMYFK